MCFLEIDLSLLDEEEEEEGAKEGAVGDRAPPSVKAVEGRSEAAPPPEIVPVSILAEAAPVLLLQVESKQPAMVVFQFVMPLLKQGMTLMLFLITRICLNMPPSRMTGGHHSIGLQGMVMLNVFISCLRSLQDKT